jgi:hypothetical protein
MSEYLEQDIDEEGLPSSYDNYSLVKHTDLHLTRPRFSGPRSAAVYPSEASVSYRNEYGDRVVEGTCLRQAFYRITGVQGKGSNARSEYIFAMGRAVEAFLISQWKEMGIWVANNIRFFTTEFGPLMNGELDCVLAEPPDGKLYTVECKSAYGYDAKKEIIGNQSSPGFPKMSQLLQTLVYVYLGQLPEGRRPFSQKIDYGRLFYLFRDTVDRRTFKVEVVPEGDNFRPMVDGNLIREFTINDMIARYQQLKQYVEQGELPPRDYSLEFTGEQIEKMREQKRISDSKYKQWESNERVKMGKSRMKVPKIIPVGNWECAYCNFCHLCHNPPDNYKIF